MRRVHRNCVLRAVSVSVVHGLSLRVDYRWYISALLCTVDAGWPVRNGCDAVDWGRLQRWTMLGADVSKIGGSSGWVSWSFLVTDLAIGGYRSKDGGKSRACSWAVECNAVLDSSRNRPLRLRCQLGEIRGEGVRTDASKHTRALEMRSSCSF